jgi:hypothetical protein
MNPVAYQSEYHDMLNSAMGVCFQNLRAVSARQPKDRLGKAAGLRHSHIQWNHQSFGLTATYPAAYQTAKLHFRR